MPEQTHPPSFQAIGVCVVLVDQDGRVLLGKRRNSYKAGWFGIPGGRVEPGEALADCAQRELTEETGLVAQRVEYVGVIKDFQNHEYDFVHFVFVCSRWSGEVVTTEPEKCESWDWYAPNELPDPVLTAHDQAIKLWQTPRSSRPAYIEM